MGFYHSRKVTTRATWVAALAREMTQLQKHSLWQSWLVILPTQILARPPHPIPIPTTQAGTNITTSSDLFLLSFFFSLPHTGWGVFSKCSPNRICLLFRSPQKRSPLSTRSEILVHSQIFCLDTLLPVFIWEAQPSLCGSEITCFEAFLGSWPWQPLPFLWAFHGISPPLFFETSFPIALEIPSWKRLFLMHLESSATVTY